METVETGKKWVALMVLGCLLFSGALFFTHLGRRDLWNPDEPRYAQIAKEMVLGHDAWVPRLNGTVYAQKPPLFFWLEAASFRGFGRMDAWAARFPVALSAVLCVLITFLIGRRLFDPWSGFFGALLLSTAVEFFWLANRVNLDTVMTLFILLSLYFIVRGLEGERRRDLCFRLAFLFAGAATVTKGPLGFIVPFLTLVVYLLLRGDFGTLKRIPWLTGLGIFFLVLVAGLGPACFLGGKAYTRELLFHQTLTRYLHGFNHRKGFSFYLYTFPEALLPWVIFLPSAIVLALKKGRGEKTRSALLFVAVWALANLLFISFSKSKRQLYILSLVPAGCLFIGYYLGVVYRGLAKPTPWFKVPVYALGVFTVVAGIVLPFAPYGIKTRFPDLALPLEPFILMGILAIAAGGLLCVLNGMKKPRAVIWVMIISLWAVFFTDAGWIMPRFNPVKSPRAVGREIQALKNQGYDVRIYGGLERTGILFYTDLAALPTVPPVPREVSVLKDIPNIAVLLRKKQLEKFAQMAETPLKVLWRRRQGRRVTLILAPEKP